MSDVKALMCEFAPSTGLRDHIVPFSKVGSLGSRLGERALLMAPMAGVSDAAYRIMARAGGAGLAYTEMVSVAGLHYHSAKTWDLVEPDAFEPDVAVQLFGSEPDQFREAVSAVQERLGNRLALIDVNMACPVPKVTKGGAGAGLLDDPSRASEILRACVIEAVVPVTAKIRRGRTVGQDVSVAFARVLEEAGAAAIAVHGRYASQLYRGEADWSVVSRVVDAVGVPVIGSGDVADHASALRMRSETGCAAVMVARGTYGNPWVFGDTVPTIAQRLAAFSCHVRLLDATGAHMARARSLAGWYLRGMPHAAKWRNRAMECVRLEDYISLADDLMERSREEDVLQ